MSVRRENRHLHSHFEDGRRLHIRWVAAAERRLVSRALYQAGFSQRHIAAMLGVSPTTVGKDIAC